MVPKDSLLNLTWKQWGIIFIIFLSLNSLTFIKFFKYISYVCFFLFSIAYSKHLKFAKKNKIKTETFTTLFKPKKKSEIQDYKCNFCSAEIYSINGYHCPYCGNYHCQNHRLPEEHECSNPKKPFGFTGGTITYSKGNSYYSSPKN